MIYPSAPASLKLGWENPLTLEQKPVIDRRGGGIERRSRNFQINLSKEIQEVSCTMTTVYSHLELDNFLKGRNGKPFLFLGVLWRCTQWQWSFLGGVNEENTVARLTCQLVQVFR